MKRSPVFFFAVLLILGGGSCAHDDVTGVPAMSATSTAPAIHNNLILFASDQFGGEPELMLVRPNGTGRQRLTTDGQGYGSPDLSPDGRLIAFTRPNADFTVWTIYVMNADGSGQRPVVTRTSVFNGQPTWSPDGTRLAFVSLNDGPFGPFGRIFVVNLDGTGLRQISPDGNSQIDYTFDLGPSWSPDGTRIVFTRNGRLHVVNPDGTGFAALPNEDFAEGPSWSPDGTRIVYGTFSSIRICNADGSHPVTVNSSLNQEGAPRWSQDGRQLLFDRVNDQFIVVLYVINVDGSGEAKVSSGGFNDFAASWTPSPSSAGAGGVVVEVAPATSAVDLGGTQQFSATVRNSAGAVLSNASVTWSSSNPAVATVTPTGLVTGVARGLAQIRASFGNDTGRAAVNVAMLTLRNAIVYGTIETGSFDLGVVRPDGSDRHILARCNQGCFDPAVSPDGRRIAFRIFGQGIFLMNADGTDFTPLVARTSFDGSPTWSPDGRMIAFVSVHDSPMGQEGRIFIINVDGTGLRQLTPDDGDPNLFVGDGYPSWSPDGTRLAFFRNGDLYLINADGTGMAVFPTPGGGYAPVWSPDGTRIAYVNFDPARHVAIIGVDGSNPVTVTSGPDADDTPSWAPDGRRLVFVRFLDGFSQLFVINDDGSGLTRLSSNPSVFDYSPNWSPVP